MMNLHGRTVHNQSDTPQAHGNFSMLATKHTATSIKNARRVVIPESPITDRASDS
jgi:hypothetical protein